MAAPRRAAKPAAPAPAPKPAAPVFLYEQVVALPADLPGEPNAAVTAALNAGHRPAGKPYVEKQEDDRPGHAVRVTWAVPVEVA